MATIDKSLPNTKTEIEIPGEEVLIGAQEETIENEKGKETDITMEEDGSATVNFDGNICFFTFFIFNSFFLCSNKNFFSWNFYFCLCIG